MFFMVPSWLLRSQVGFHGFSWFQVDFSWFLLLFHSSRSVFIVFQGSRSVYMAFHGSRLVCHVFFMVPGWIFIVPG